jgi:hypothetical protein|tara:strand:- start:106 stop:276 length:171 start_codon:yes stop_codon:yes gene_type:complete
MCYIDNARIHEELLEIAHTAPGSKLGGKTGKTEALKLARTVCEGEKTDGGFGQSSS